MQDYRFKDKPKRRSGRLLLWAALLVGIGFAVWKLLDRPANEAAQPAGQRSIPLTLPDQSNSAGSHTDVALAAAEPAQRWTHYEVVSGDTLSTIFGKLELPYAQLNDILALGKNGKRFTHLRPGQRLRVQHHDDGGFARLEFEEDDLGVLRLSRTDEGLQFEQVPHDIEYRARFVLGSIEQSLFADGRAAGMSDASILQLADMFGWDIDFALDLRVGDRFTALVEDIYKDGELLREGNILAAEFINRDRTLRAVRYTDPSGKSEYYSPDGKTMRKAFLRNPIDVVRITSGFNLRRKHPVLNRIRAHKGVDYGAPTGTPVRAAGDGTIVHRARKGGYGRTVIVKHANGRSTLYAHLSRYGKPKKGKRVKQGQVVGYVGKSGLATGPHLHYEFRVNGKHVNPQRVKLGTPKPLAKKYRADFKQQSGPILAQLDAVNRVLAQADTQ